MQLGILKEFAGLRKTVPTGTVYSEVHLDHVWLLRELRCVFSPAVPSQAFTQRHFYLIRAHLQASYPGRREAILEGTCKGVEQNALAGRLTEVGCQVAQQDGGIGSDCWLLINLSDTRCQVCREFLQLTAGKQQQQ